MSKPQPQQQASAAPDIPPHIQNRRPVALTAMAAEDGSAVPREGLTIGEVEGSAPSGQGKPSRKALTARQAAEKLFAAEPLKGIPAADIEAVRGRSYTGAPKMDATLGDRTPAFVNWLFKHHPKDAAMRYCYRDVWPTE